MVEFYRIITNAEMESSKPGFCIFPIYAQPGLDCQLALKYSRHIDPIPIENVILVFNILTTTAYHPQVHKILDNQ
jgi:hypothetical protein